MRAKTINEFERGKDPLDAIGIGMRAEMYKFLEEHEGTKHMSGKYGTQSEVDSALLVFACKYGRTDWVKFLLGQNVNVNHWDGAPLKWAMIKGHEDIVKLLKDAGAYDIKDDTIRQIRHKYRKLKESINFERGKNPLDAMNIGNVHQRKIDEIRRAAKILIYDYNSNPKTIMENEPETVFDVAWQGKIGQRKCIYFIGYDFDRKFYYAGIEDPNEPLDQTTNHYKSIGSAMKQIRDWNES